MRAHATTPNMGQGACQAIEDAVVLADELGENGDKNRTQKTLKRRPARTHYITNIMDAWQNCPARKTSPWRI